MSVLPPPALGDESGLEDGAHVLVAHLAPEIYVDDGVVVLENVWAVDNAGIVYEAQLSNLETGEYHGFQWGLGGHDETGRSDAQSG